MFKVLMRGVVNWTSGFGRYLDLLVGCALLVIGLHWSEPFTIALAAVALLSFAIDFNGRFQRWMMNGMLAMAGKR